MTRSKRSEERLPKAAQRVSTANQFKGFTAMPSDALEIAQKMDAHEFVNNSFFVLSVSSVVKSAESG
jgi:hypothetical protein